MLHNFYLIVLQVEEAPLTEFFLFSSLSLIPTPRVYGS